VIVNERIETFGSATRRAKPSASPATNAKSTMLPTTRGREPSLSRSMTV